jgi:hypothetical protein
MLLLSGVKKFFTEIATVQHERLMDDIDLDDEICYGDFDLDDDICYGRDDKYSRSDRRLARRNKTASKQF